MGVRVPKYCQSVKKITVNFGSDQFWAEFLYRIFYLCYPTGEQMPPSPH